MDFQDSSGTSPLSVAVVLGDKALTRYASLTSVRVVAATVTTNASSGVLLVSCGPVRCAEVALR